MVLVLLFCISFLGALVKTVFILDKFESRFIFSYRSRS
jgi:hypothetical protein